MPSSRQWRLYCEHNVSSLLEIPWESGADLMPEASMAQSLREFQAGESFEGKHLLGYAREYARRTGDPEGR